MVLEQRFFIKRFWNISGAGWYAFGIQSLHELFTPTTDTFRLNSQYIGVIGAPVFSINLMRTNACKSGYFLGEQIAELGALGRNPLHAVHLSRSKGGLKFAHAIIRCQT